MIKSISWEEGTLILHELLPCCNQFVPDAITDAAAELGIAVDFLSVDNWEQRKDWDIFSEIMPSPIISDERLMLINDLSFINKTGPFLMNGEDFKSFVDTHQALYAESSVNGDVIILLPDRRSIVLFHHDGYHATISCKRS